MSAINTIINRIITLFFYNSRIKNFLVNIFFAFSLQLYLKLSFESWIQSRSGNSLFFRNRFFVALDWMRYGKTNGVTISDRISFEDLLFLFSNFNFKTFVLNLKELRRFKYYGKIIERKNLNELSKPFFHVIVPIFNAYTTILETLPIILEQAQLLKLKVILINDSSSDERVEDYLNELKFSFPNIELIHNSNNLGYTKSVNLGLNLYPRSDFLILNSDVIIPKDFFTKMLEAGNANPKALISPIEITPAPLNDIPFSLPLLPKHNVNDVKNISKILNDFNLELSNSYDSTYVISPTGHGFALFIPNSIRKKIGVFNEQLFPKGYGEENYYSQLAYDSKFKSLIRLDLAVFHYTTKSFDKNVKYQNSKDALVIIDKFYKFYKLSVKYFTDISGIRLRLLNIFLDFNKFNIHQVVSYGGGSKRFANSDFDFPSTNNVYLYTKSNSVSAEIFLNQIDEIPFLTLDIYSNNFRLLLNHSNLQRYISHFLAENISSTSLIISMLPKSIERILRLHDYHVVCPQYFFSDQKFEYCGEPDFNTCAKCISVKSPTIKTGINSWRLQFLNLVKLFNLHTVPSSDMKTRLSKYFPNMDFQIYVPIDLQADSKFDFVINNRFGGKNIAVLGHIGLDKGLLNLYDIVNSDKFIASDIKCFGFGEFQIIDDLNSDNLFLLGPYDDADLESLYFKILSLNIGYIFFPVKIPETYSLVLSNVIRMNLPVIAYDIGAIPERLRACNLKSLILAMSDTTDVVVDKIINFVSLD